MISRLIRTANDLTLPVSRSFAAALTLLLMVVFSIVCGIAAIAVLFELHLLLGFAGVAGVLAALYAYAVRPLA